MNGKELTTRLISDIKASIELRGNTQNHFQQIGSVISGETPNLKSFSSSINFILFDDFLDKIPQFFDEVENIFEHKKGEKVDVIKFHNSLIAKESNVSIAIQKILDGNQVDRITLQPIANIFVNLLNQLHNVAN